MASAATDIQRNTKIIYIEGNIGSGKTTFVSLLKDYLKLKNLKYTIVKEPVDEWMNTKDSSGTNILEYFYSNQNKWSYAFQMNSFISRVKSIDDARKSNKYDIIFIERSVYTDRYCFAENCFQLGNMTEMEYNIYINWHDWLCENFNTKPSGYVYLKTSPTVSFHRVNKRLRDGEGGIELEYLESLHIKHNNWLENEEKNNTRVLTLDVSEDFVNSSSMNEMVNKIIKTFNLN
jgi:deoxyadenosine/deoxycytidine kinase